MIIFSMTMCSFQIENMRAVILHGIISVPNGPPQPQHFGGPGLVPNHFGGPMQSQNGGRGGGHNVMGNGRGGRLVVAGSVVSQWDNNRGGSAQQMLAKARNNKNKKALSAKSQNRRQPQKVKQQTSRSFQLSAFSVAGLFNGHGSKFGPKC